MHSPITLPGIPIAPQKLPVLGHMRRSIKELFPFLERTHQELGPIFWYNMGFGIWSLVVNGEPTETIMRNKQTRSDLLDNQIPHITKHTLLVHDGAEHKRMRGAMNAPFTPKGLSVSEVGSLIEGVLDKHLAGWGDGKPMNILNITSEFALDVIFRILGTPIDSLPLWREKFGRFIGRGLLIPLDFPGTPIWHSKRAAKWLDHEFSKLIQKAREEGDTETLLGALTHGQDEKGQTLKEEELLANLKILALAGHETTASILAWAMIYSADRDDIWQRLKEEADGATLPKSPQELKQFPYAEALFREVLRLYPPVGLLPPRRVEEEIEVYGVKIPKDTRLSVNLLGLSRDPNLYPEPHECQPERWINREKRPTPAEAVQFGGGPHFCLGYHLALLEGVQFIVGATKKLVEHNLKPTLQGPIPTPQYIPLTRPPAKTQLFFKTDNS